MSRGVDFAALHARIQRALRTDVAEAARLVREYERAAVREGGALERAMATFERAQLRHVRADPRRARADYAAARARFARLGAQRHALAADLGAIVVAAQLGDRADVLRTAARIRRAAESTPHGAAAELSIGTALLHLGDLRGAEHASAAAVERAGRSRAAAPLRARALLHLATCHARRGAFRDALRGLDAAERTFRAHGLDAEAEAVRLTRGWALGVQGDTAGALDALAAAEAALAARGDPVRAAHARLDRAQIAAWSGDAEGARDGARGAARELAARGQRCDAARALLVVARACEVLGDTAGARAAARRARATFVSARERLGVAQADVLLGRDLAHAERTLRRGGAWIAAWEALLADARSRAPGDAARLLRRRGAAYPAALRRWLAPDVWRLRAAGEPAHALAHLRRACRAVEELRGRAPTVRLRGAALGSRLGAYADLAAALLRRGGARDRVEAFVVLDAVRARLLRDEVGGAAAFDRPEVRALRERLEQVWRGMEHDEGGLGDVRVSGAVALDEVTRCERELLDAARAVATAPARAADAALPKDPTLAFAVLGADVVGLFADAGEVRAWRAGALGDVAHELAALRFQVTRRLSGAEDVRPAERVLARLSALLLAGGPPEFPERLVAVLPPEFGILPLEALPWRDAPLVERTTVVHAACACLPPARPRTRGSALVVGLGGDELPDVLDEVRDVATALGGADVLAGADARRSAVLAALRGRRVVHVAGHARARDDAPPLSALRVGDGWLAAADLTRGLDRATVVLSACRTGDLGLRHDGEGLAGFPRALLAAGAGAVVASRWEVADDVAHLFMRRFYAAWRGGAPEDAVAAAARSVRAQHPHPADWAAFLALRGVGATLGRG